MDESHASIVQDKPMLKQDPALLKQLALEALNDSTHSVKSSPDDHFDTVASGDEDDDEKKTKRKKLLERTNHTMCTVQVKYAAEEERLKRMGFRLFSFKSYIFGGLELEADGRLTTSNELIEVSTRQVVAESAKIALLPN